MTRILTNFVRVLGMLAILSFVAEPLQADPTVIFTAGGENPTDILRLCNPFILGTTNANGTLTAVLRSPANTLITEFQFRSQNQGEGNEWTGGDPPFPFFSFFISSTSGIDFSLGGTGPGIAESTTFTITFTNFLPGSQIIAHPRGDVTIEVPIPEPATILLLGTGLAGVAFRTRKRLKSRISGTQDN